MSGILRTIARMANRHDPRPPGLRQRPERVVLDVRGGVAPSSKPPVRIFVGTEPAQERAERVFIWSIEQCRDPARVYEIHLMADLAGFDRHRWLTGFTNYRFAIPHFAGERGRAIYNDVDQIYLDDPAALFDLDMGGCGYPVHQRARDTSVMLIDCARMVDVWSLDLVQRRAPQAHRSAHRAPAASCGVRCRASGTRATRNTSPGAPTSCTTPRSTPSPGSPFRSASSTSPIRSGTCGWRSSAPPTAPATGSSPPSARALNIWRLIAHRPPAGEAPPAGAAAAPLRGGAKSRWPRPGRPAPRVSARAGPASTRHRRGAPGRSVRASRRRRRPRQPRRRKASTPSSAATGSSTCRMKTCRGWSRRCSAHARRCVYICASARCPGSRRLADGTMHVARRDARSWWQTQSKAPVAAIPAVRWKLVFQPPVAAPPSAYTRRRPPPRRAAAADLGAGGSQGRAHDAVGRARGRARLSL